MNTKLKFVLPKSVLFALILCLGAASLPAQELEMRAPPIPGVIPTPPPDPDTLPPPPGLQWESLLPKGWESRESSSVAAFVPPPEPEPSIAPPPPPVVEPLVPGLPDPAAVELAKPDVEIWPGGIGIPTGADAADQSTRTSFRGRNGTGHSAGAV